jgi:Ras-related protein Rab-18
MANKGPSVKILVNGESGVGKSSLLQRYTLGSFDEHIPATIGVDFRVARLNNPLGDEQTDGDCSSSSSSSRLGSVSLQIWDTAGQEKFKSLSASYYRNAAAALFVYDVTSRESFNALKRWMDDTTTHCGPGVVMMLVANKIDLLSTVSNDFTAEELSKAQEFARDHQMSYCRCSAKTKEGVAHAFEHVARLACQKPEFMEKWGSNENNNNNNTNNLGNNNTNSTTGNSSGENATIGKRIDLNRPMNNGTDDENGGGGAICGAC